MFDLIHRKKRLVQIILAAVMLPFAFWGVDSWVRQSESIPVVATVAGERITLAELEAAIREQQDRLRATLGSAADPAMFDNPEVRMALVDGLIAQRLLARQAVRDNFVASDRQLERIIVSHPAFQVDGKFSPERVRAVLANQGMNEAMLEQQLRRELMMRPLQDPFGAATIVSSAQAERFLALAEERREVSVAVIDVESFAAQIKVDEAEAKAHYDANVAAYQVPEQVRVETLTLSLDAIASKTKPDAAEVKAYYEANAPQYREPEQRRASHVLVGAGAEVKGEQREAARKKAEAIAAEVRADPKKLADIARASSDDPGTREQGGDLGFAPRGTYTKAFDDALFAMKVGEVSGPIETEFGYHVIRLDAVNPERVQPFEEVRGRIEEEVGRQKAARRFAEAAEQFQNLVYEHADSLEAAAKAVGIEPVKSDWLTRAQVQALARGNAKFVQAVFAPETVQSKRNTEAVEVAPSTLMAARVLEHKPATPRPFAEVKDEIVRQLTRGRASELAAKVGREKLEAARQGKDPGLKWDAPREIGRGQRQPGINEDVVAQVFRVDPAKLPAYVGGANERGGFSLVRVSKVSVPAKPDKARLEAATQQLREAVSRELYAAYVASLRQAGDVKIRQENIERKSGS